jgi:ferredoxin
MANPNKAHADNVPGAFFVDETCIDCDLCRQIAPSVFSEAQDHSFVSRQPDSDVEVHRAAMALVACPTGSIGTRHKLDMREAIDSFPELVEENVYFCGFASEHSFGASSYLIVRPEGNILIDSPRFAKSLVGKIEEMGGISMMFMTHRTTSPTMIAFMRNSVARESSIVMTRGVSKPSAFWKESSRRGWIPICLRYRFPVIRADTWFYSTGTSISSAVITWHGRTARAD